MRRIIAVIAVLIVVGGGAYAYLSQNSAKPTGQATPTAIPAVRASGDVVAEAEVLPFTSAELNLAAQGIISEVLVSEGDRVKKDQLLARVDSKRQAAAVNQSQAALGRAQASQARTQATLAKVKAVLAQLKAGPRAEDIATAAAAVSVAQAQLSKAQAGADTTALAQAKANMDKAARAVQQAQATYDRVKDTPFGNIGPDALRLEQTTIDYDAAKTAYEQLVLGPRETDINVVKAQVAQAQAALAQVQVGARPEAIAAAEADVTAAEADAKAVDSDVASAEAALKQAQAALADTELHAPFDGSIVTVNIKQGQVAPTTSFAIRIADIARWKISTKDLTELSVSRLKVGNTAEVRFDAIPDLKLTGKVTRIDDFGTNRQGDIVYAVTITPDTLDPRLRWNMTASVTVKAQ